MSLSSRKLFIKVRLGGVGLCICYFFTTYWFIIRIKAVKRCFLITKELFLMPQQKMGYSGVNRNGM
jgi:hypothetical protein